jgi:hypothetical protein
LRPQDIRDEEQFKYGTKYFKIMEEPEEGSLDPTYRELRNAHPTHCYIAEPIPQEHLGYFIKLFYWQSNLFFNKLKPKDAPISTIDISIFTNLKHIFNHE